MFQQKTFTEKEQKAFNTVKNYLIDGLQMEYKLNRSKILNELLLDIGITYVVDPFTKEIIWANDKLRAELGEEIIGERCHVALQGNSKPCSFCKFAEVFENPGVPYTWIHKNPKNGKVYLVIDIYLDEGFNGYERPLHLEKAFEITDEHIKKILELKNWS